MRSFKRFISIKLFFRVSMVFTILLISLLAVDLFIIPIHFWMVLASLFSLPFLSVSFWIQSVRKENNFITSYFIIFVLSLICFIFFTWAFFGGYISILGHLVVVVFQLIIGAQFLLNLEKLGRYLGAPPFRTSARLNFY